MSPETQQRIQYLRHKASINEITLEEMQEAVRLLRADRTRAATVSEVSRSKKSQAKAVVKSADDMLDELGGGS